MLFAVNGGVTSKRSLEKYPRLEEIPDTLLTARQMGDEFSQAVDGIVIVRLSYDRAVTEPCDQKASVSQRSYAFAHRRPADPERPHELAFGGETGADRQLAVLDHFGKRVGNDAGKRPRQGRLRLLRNRLAHLAPQLIGADRYR